MTELVLDTKSMSRGRTVRWMLDEAGAPYRTEVLEFGTTMKSSACLAINPKSIVFFVAFVPQFINHGANVTEQFSVLTITFVSMAALNAALFAKFAASARSLLSSPRARRRFNIGGGTLLASAGVWGLLAKRPA